MKITALILLAAVIAAGPFVWIVLASMPMSLDMAAQLSSALMMPAVAWGALVGLCAFGVYARWLATLPGER